PLPTTLPSLTSTAPTTGLGAVRPIPRRASRRASAINRSASRGILYCWAVLRGSALRLSLLPAFLEFIQFLQFLHKFFNVPERPVDRCKSHVRHVIHLPEFFHNPLAYVCHFNFFFR